MKHTQVKRLPRMLAALAIATLVTTGCATGVSRLSSETPLERYMNYAGTPVNSFTAFNVTGWTSLSDTRLVVWTGVNEAWLLTVWSGCQELSFADRIRIKSTGSSIMRGDTVLVRRDRCPIAEIRPIDVKRMKADREADREATAAPSP
jgi:hypothetical protein